jgi:hypothetical protein
VPDYGGYGCHGRYYERAALRSWRKVELVKYPFRPFWIARVYDQYGNALDVAKIRYNNPTNYDRIYRATATTEESYISATDPYMEAYFFHSHPKYYIGGTNPFANWPASSSSEHNWLNTTPSASCPNHYYAVVNWNGDPRKWYTGIPIHGTGVCSKNPLF